MGNFYRGAGCGSGFDLGRAALENRSGSGTLRLRNRPAPAGRTSRRNAGGKAAVDEWRYVLANALDRAGADRGVQCRVVVVDCEGVEGDPRPPIRPCSILKVFFLSRRLAALSGPDSRPVQCGESGTVRGDVFVLPECRGGVEGF